MWLESEFRLITCSLDKMMRCWDITDIRSPATKRVPTSRAYSGYDTVGHTRGVNCVCHAGGGVVITGGFDFTLYGWDASRRAPMSSTKRPLFKLEGHRAPIVSVTCACRGKAVSIDLLSLVRVWRLDSDLLDEDRCIQIQVPLNPYTPRSVAMCLPNDVIVSGGSKLHILASKPVRPTSEVRVHGHWVTGHWVTGHCVIVDRFAVCWFADMVIDMVIDIVAVTQ